MLLLHSYNWRSSMSDQYHDLWRDEIVTYLEHNNIAFDEGAISKLLTFLSLLYKWNKTHNLTAIKPENYILKHVIDSLCLLPYVKGKRFLDVGTGAGFPGIVLAIFATNCEVVLLDIQAKKCCFLRQAVHEAGLKNATVEHQSILDYNPNRSFDIVVARAFTAMENMVSMVKHVCNRNNGVILAMKAKLENNEVAALTVKHEVITITPATADITRCIVKVSPFEQK